MVDKFGIMVLRLRQQGRHEFKSQLDRSGLAAAHVYLDIFGQNRLHFPVYCPVTSSSVDASYKESS